MAKGVELRLAVAPDTPEAVMADAVRVRQIILNLLGNSIKFTPPGGLVTLSVSGRGKADGIVLAVRDTGSGVPPEIVPYLFQDFMLCPVADATPDGTGMGLSICSSLAQAMGGTIRYDPAPEGTGSVFKVDLPLPRAEPIAIPPAKPVPPNIPRAAGARRVLVVDDVPTNRRLAEVLLRQAGFEVALAADGAEAVAALRQGQIPDVVLMDIYMPGMDGIAATRHIRGLPGAIGQIPIIALTADASPDQIRACEAAGTNGYVAKPFSIEALLASIRAVLPETMSGDLMAPSEESRPA